MAGPIQGFEDRQEYRVTLKSLLEKTSCEVVDPWGREAVYYESGEVDVSRAKSIVERDLRDIDGCDVLVAYLPILSAGVCMELFYAKRAGKTTIVICELKNPSPWIVAHSDRFFRSIEEFKAFLRDDLLGE